MRNQVRRAALIAISALTLTGASPPPDAGTRLNDVVESYQIHTIQRDLYAQVTAKQISQPLPTLSRTDLMREARFASALLARLNKIPTEKLQGEDRLTYAMLNWLLRDMQTLPSDYDYVFPAPYGFFEFSYIPTALATNAVSTPAERKAYAALIASVGARFRATAQRVADQQRRGVVMPKRQLPRTLGALKGVREQIAEWGATGLARAPEASRAAFALDIAKAVSAAETGADALVAALGERYAAAAKDAVGLSQYPGGTDYYRMLVRRTTTSEVTPEELRDLGQRLLDENNVQLETLAKELGVPNGRAGLRDYTNKNPRFIATKPEDVVEKYRTCLAPIEPKLSEFYGAIPKAPYRSVRLEPENEPGMTFGYYEQPSPTQAYGQYRFNGSNLADRSLVSACALIFHELVPGHHLQAVVAQENEALPPFRRTALIGAFQEGWAEYSSNQAREMGGYEDRNDLLGRLMLNSMIYTRLVVDVGLNLDGWTFDRAKAFMLANTHLSEREIESEVLRYSADIPSQALAYGSGMLAMQALRRDAQQRQGKAFDIRAFHREMVIHGTLPIDVLRAHLLRALPEVK
jgi:uncharacterized protein (DUF885 family)